MLNGLLIKYHSFAIAQQRLFHRLEPAPPWNLTIGYLQYREQLQEMEKLLSGNHNLPPLEQFDVNPDTMPDTLILVLGESTNSKRMSLYGYSRPTTPKLDAMRDELIIFNDVVTPRPYLHYRRIATSTIIFRLKKYPGFFLISLLYST